MSHDGIHGSRDICPVVITATADQAKKNGALIRFVVRALHNNGAYTMPDCDSDKKTY